MNTVTSCNTSSLSVYRPSSSNPWNADKVKHIYRRLAYGASFVTIKSAINKSPDDLVDEFMDTAKVIPPIPAPDWLYKTRKDFNSNQEFEESTRKNVETIKEKFTVDILTKGFKSRMVLFWMNHFVTQLETYNCSTYLFLYHDLLQKHALGNFKEFVRLIGTTPAMLKYLNGFDNTKEKPNENYARELFELFTMGEGSGYKQKDIEEASRALTGYNSESTYCGRISFDNNTFDNREKEIFGEKGNWNHDDVVRILFEKHSDIIATFICGKLYAFFVSPNADEPNAKAIIKQMASTFVNSDFEIDPVLRQLFKSEHFFDPSIFGVLIKSPIDLTHQFLKETTYGYGKKQQLKTIQYLHSSFGQKIFHPVDVKGWQRDHDWISSSTLTNRWIRMQWVLNNCKNEEISKKGKSYFRQFVKDVSGNSKDPEIITKAVIDHFMAKELATPNDYKVASIVFKGDLPENYYTNGTWSLDYNSVDDQIEKLLDHIIRMPEYQLK